MRNPLSLAPHFHEEMQIVLSEHRLVSYTLRGSRVLSPLGSLFIIEPGLVHAAHIERVQPSWGDLRTLLISPTRLQWYMGLPRAAEMTCRMPPIVEGRQVLRSFRLAHDFLMAGGDELARESALVVALSQLAKCGRFTQPRSFAARRPMWRIREHLGSDLSRRLSLSEIAAEASLSPFHLIREFRRTFGLSPHAFRKQLRVLRARDLLAAGVAISDVAQQTGFADHAHLTRTFQRAMGVPPSRYIFSARSFKTAQHN